MREGDSGRNMFIIKKGTLKVLKNVDFKHPDTHKKIKVDLPLNEIEEGSFFGEEILYESFGGNYLYTVKVVSPECQLLSFEKSTNVKDFSTILLSQSLKKTFKQKSKSRNSLLIKILESGIDRILHNYSNEIRCMLQPMKEKSRTDGNDCQDLDMEININHLSDLPLPIHSQNQESQFRFNHKKPLSDIPKRLKTEIMGDPELVLQQIDNRVKHLRNSSLNPVSNEQEDIPLKSSPLKQLKHSKVNSSNTHSQYLFETSPEIEIITKSSRPIIRQKRSQHPSSSRQIISEKSSIKEGSLKSHPTKSFETSSVIRRFLKANLKRSEAAEEGLANLHASSTLESDIILEAHPSARKSDSKDPIRNYEMQKHVRTEENHDQDVKTSILSKPLFSLNKKKVFQREHPKEMSSVNLKITDLVIVNSTNVSYLREDQSGLDALVTKREEISFPALSREFSSIRNNQKNHGASEYTEYSVSPTPMIHLNSSRQVSRQPSQDVMYNPLNYKLKQIDRFLPHLKRKMTSIEKKTRNATQN